MVGTEFEIGDLVWAKMKNFPFWPGKIINPPSKAKSTTKRAQHYVLFFGTENHAWILDENIVHHSEEMLQSNSKKKSSFLKQAVDKIIEESKNVPFKIKPPIQNTDDIDMQPGTSYGTNSERRPSTSQRGKSKYESAKKRYFVKVQKASQNQYLTKMHKKVRKKYFTDKSKSSKLKEGCSSSEMNGEVLEGVLRTFCGKVQTTKKKIGFLGLGKMGQKIVRKLIESEHNVTVWNRTRSKCTEFVDLGAQCGVSPASVVAKCDVTFCCVSGSEAVKTLAFAADGILAGFEGTREKGYVELTTVDPLTAEEIAEAIGHKGGKYLESPLTESKRPDSESLLAVCSGDYELFRTCESCFYAFSSDAYFLSSTVGNGSNMNLLLSMVMNTVYAALSESLALTRKLNLPQESLLEFMKYSPLDCHLLRRRGKIMTSDEFFSDNIFKYQQRDLSLALAIADSYEQPMPITAAANEFYKRPVHLLFE